MDLHLAQRVAVVTGAGRGIGRAIARMLARDGARVVLAARTRAELEAVEREIRDAGGRACCVRTDLTDEASIRGLFETTVRREGAPDLLINNAGVGLYGPLADFDSAALDRVLDVNLRGTFLCCREAMRIMIPRRRGYIINIVSVVGIKGYPRQAAYTAAKHGVLGLTKSLAVEAQEHGIRVSAVLPGGVNTPMARQSRPDLDPGELMEPEDVAQAVAYLLSLSDRAAVDQIYIRRRNSSPF